jgi:hypothetical protein
MVLFEAVKTSNVFGLVQGTRCGQTDGARFGLEKETPSTHLWTRCGQAGCAGTMGGTTPSMLMTSAPKQSEREVKLKF